MVLWFLESPGQLEVEVVVVDTQSYWMMSPVPKVEDTKEDKSVDNPGTEVPVVPVDLEVLAVLEVLVVQLWLSLEGLLVLGLLVDLVVPANLGVLEDLVVHRCQEDLDIPSGQEDLGVLDYRRCLVGQAVLVLEIHWAMCGHRTEVCV